MQKNMILVFIIAIVIFLLQVECTYSTQHASDYQRLKDLHNNLVKSQANTKEWNLLINAYKKLYEQKDTDEVTREKVLFMLGRAYRDVYLIHKNEIDLNNAINVFEKFVNRYPRSSLADDALYELFKLYLNVKNFQKSDELLCKIIKDYPDGDKFSLAETILKNNKAYYDSCTKTKNQSVNTKNTDTILRSNKTDIKIADSKVKVNSIKHWSTKDYTRIVIEVTDKTIYKYNRLISEGDKKKASLYVDIYNAIRGEDIFDYLNAKSPFLKSIRTSQFTPDRVRIVIDLDTEVKYKVFTMDDPFKIIVDIVGEHYKKEIEDNRLNELAKEEIEKEEYRLLDNKAHISQEKQKEINKKDQNKIEHKRTSSKPTLAQQLGLSIQTIVIDPGHGGKDPGAIGKNGLQEKDIVIKVARYLKEELKQLGFNEVYLTRNSDVYLPLEERTAIANTKKADIFISIHVNSEPSGIATGVETYVLNFAVDEHAMRTAALENAVSTKKMAELRSILNEIIKNSKLEESKRLAKHVQKNTVKTARIKNRKLRDNGVKMAPFFVLVGAQMPAILVEIGFISNKYEESLLDDNTYLRLIAKGIASGIKDYSKTMKLAHVTEIVN